MTTVRPAIRAVLCDIEGTTTDVRFVHDVLFPYAAARIPAWVAANPGAPELVAVADETGAATPEAQTAVLLGWMTEDRKATPLKAIQGQLWACGYADGTLHAHVYPDVASAFARWTSAGLRVAIYSSGSVQAQHLLFGATDAGDLRPHITGWFDTTTGPKRAAASYSTIAAALGLVPDEVLFLSDTPEELDAAALAGMPTCLLARNGAPAPCSHPVAATFAGLLG